MASQWGYVTDGGLETDLIFHRGMDLPEFAAYPLVRTEEGRKVLRDYYQEYAEIAARARTGLRLETPTWRANTDWGAKLGDDKSALSAVNRAAVEFVREIAETWGDRVSDIVVSGNIGPRGQGYVGGEVPDPDEAAEYHSPQLEAFAKADADHAAALTLTSPGEAIGVVRAAEAAGLPVMVSFTVEPDGRLPDGTPLSEAVQQVDETAPPASFMVNCAHPTHVLPAFGSDGAWAERIQGVRVNASRLTHAELDEAEELGEADLGELVPAHRRLEEKLPSLVVVGGCCGTDARHVAALWGV
ncbi:MAG TPA: homocysteine S-methyltransferase family protein [Nocardioides sp.]|jgi:S-methylmethionine-dependent homocysteine/selenocysteine methylase|nr:homocysteine S-methyltransferase family protein [Nocardioides sp.]